VLNFAQNWRLKQPQTIEKLSVATITHLTKNKHNNKPWKRVYNQCLNKDKPTDQAPFIAAFLWPPRPLKIPQYQLEIHKQFATFSSNQLVKVFTQKALKCELNQKTGAPSSKQHNYVLFGVRWTKRTQNLVGPQTVVVSQGDSRRRCVHKIHINTATTPKMICQHRTNVYRFGKHKKCKLVQRLDHNSAHTLIHMPNTQGHWKLIS
jgi:hypothetical protein